MGYDRSKTANFTNSGRSENIKIGKMSETEKIPEISKSIYDRTGFSPMMTLFRFYGFRFETQPGDPKSPMNRLQVAIALSVSIASCILCGAMATLVSLSVDDVTLQDASIAIQLILVTLRVPATYVHFCSMFERGRLLQRHLGATVDAIRPLGRRHDYVRKIRQCSRMAVAFMVGSTTVGIAITVYGMWANYVQVSGHLKIVLHVGSDWPVLPICGQALVTLWEVVGNSFVIACAAHILVTCKALETCFNGHLPAATISLHQSYHERLCVLVAEANEVMALNMLSSLSEQTLVVLLYFASGFRVGTLPGLFLSLKLTVVFLMTTVCCSNVNEKVTSSLLRNSPQAYEDLHHYSAEHINYTMYLSQCSTNTVKLTYGNIFSINKSFIFTIAGTILTYTLILKDIA